MGFWDEFSSCMHGSGLPTPAEVRDSAGEALEFLEELHHAAEVAGGVDVSLGALEAAGFAGFGGELAVDAAATTVSFYAGACAGCVVGATGSAIADWLAQLDVGPDVRSEIVTAANDAGITLDQAIV
jgi:hypothetical protein